MIQKCISYNGSFGTLIDYIDREATDDFIVVHNIGLGLADREQVLKAFIENDKYRKRTKVRCQHIILSFHPKDKVSNEQMRTLIDFYLHQRQMINCVFYGRIHRDSKGRNVHFHGICSQNLYQKNKSIRLSKSDFVRLHNELQDEQKQRFPDLVNSVAYMDEKGRERETQKQTKVKGKKRKQALEKLQMLAEQAKNLSHWYELIQAHSDFTLYSRGNTQNYGVYYQETHLKVRLKSALDPVRYQVLERLDTLRKMREKNRDLPEQDRSITF